MNFYEQLVTGTQMMNFSQHYDIYAMGGTPFKLTKKAPLAYDESIDDFIKKVKEADCIVVGGASGLSAAGGGDFYYTDTPSFKKIFGKYAKKYGFKGAFAGMQASFVSAEERWGYLATFLHTTQHAPVRKPYVDLDAIIRDKDFYFLTTNQDTQFLRLYPEDKVAEIQGDHRFFQCSQCCCDEVWDAVEPVQKMIDAMGDGLAVPTELIPHCPHCGAEAFPWVRGYGNFLTGKKYDEQYKKILDYILAHKDQKILFLELGVGRMTPMFIQEPFWILTENLPQTTYVSVNKEYAFLPASIEDRGLAIKGDIGQVLSDVRERMEVK